jgi:hypothetical protein
MAEHEQRHLGDLRVGEALKPERSMALLDPQVARELGMVATDLCDEPLRVLASDERLDPTLSGFLP